MSPSGPWTRAALWWLLGGWVGAWGFFTMLVAPTAFRVVPTEWSGQLVSPLLRALHLYGLGAGVLLSGLGLRLGRGGLATWLPLGLATLCAVTEFGITGSVSAVRPSDYGADTPADAAARFALLHRASQILFVVIWLGALALVFVHARADAEDRVSG